MKNEGRWSHKKSCGLILLLLSSLIHPPSAAGEKGVQVISSRVDYDIGHLYTLSRLARGDMLYVFARRTSGNFDPMLVLLRPEVDLDALRQAFRTEVSEARASGRDLLPIIPELLNKFSPAWNDDFSSGYAAAIKFRVPAAGEYRLLVRSTLAGQTYGGYSLIIGVNAPEVLAGQAKDTGQRLAILDRKASRLDTAVQEVKGSLSAEKPSTFYLLNSVAAGDVLYAVVETTSGDLKPALFLDDYGDKPLLSDNSAGLEPRARLKFTFSEEAENFRLRITSRTGDGEVSSGEYRLMVGLNAPEVLEGKAVPGGFPVLKQPTAVKIGLQLHQIVSVSQKEKHISVVASVQMRWQDRALAFSPEDCLCRFRIFEQGGFEKYVSENGTVWPIYSFFNQQGRRAPQNLRIVVWPSGEVLYFERFSVTLQAPDLDFRRFPFDRQYFSFDVDSLLPEEYFVLTDLPGYSQIGAKLGEEELAVAEFRTETSRQISALGEAFSRFSFRFVTFRHLNYYFFRIFLPILLILTVSWVTFFLRDYRKRIDVSSGLLFVLVAFNFTISSDLPRLGYMTLMDGILVSAFIVTILVVVVNVYLRRLEASNKEEQARRADRYIVWLFPLAYILAVALTVLLFG
jgi:hypothetical protein